MAEEKIQRLSTLTDEEVEDLIIHREKSVLMDAVVVVAVQLKNGYVVVENSICINSERFNEQFGYELAMNRIYHRVRNLEGYSRLGR